MAICPADPETLKRAASLLRDGGVVGMPTETVYGLAAYGFHEGGVARVFEVKGRPRFDPLILHVAEGYDLAEIAEPVPEAKRLINAFWPGPLTLVLPRKASVPDIVTSGLESVAVRCPRHPVAQALLKELGGPIAAPSANRFGRVSPTTAEHVLEELGEAVPIILNGGACDAGIESTIVEVGGGRSRLLRRGALCVEKIEEVLGQKLEVVGGEAGIVAPGMLFKHYAPAKGLYLLDREIPSDMTLNEETAYLFWKRKVDRPGICSRTLSEKGDLHEAAARLFRFMRELDATSATTLLVEPVPAEGLGLAIADRLKRASVGTAKIQGDQVELLSRQ